VTAPPRVADSVGQPLGGGSGEVGDLLQIVTEQQDRGAFEAIYDRVGPQASDDVLAVEAIQRIDR
jgi:hypothetical protein